MVAMSQPDSMMKEADSILECFKNDFQRICSDLVEDFIPAGQPTPYEKEKETAVDLSVQLQDVNERIDKQLGPSLDILHDSEKSAAGEKTQYESKLEEATAATNFDIQGA